MKTRSRMTGVALMIALSMGGALSACGGSSDDAGETAETSAAPAASEAEPTADAEPTEPAAEDSGDKPSKDDVVAGYTKVIDEGSGGQLPDDILNKVVVCFVDALYDTASEQTLQAIADANAAGINPDDAKLFGDASTTCTAEITQ